MEGRKSSQIKLPLRLTFTEEGIQFFNSHNRKLEKQSLSDNAVGYGITLREYGAPFVQKMIVADYISRIEVIRTAFTEKRSEIMDTSKLVFYGMLYRKFSAAVASRMLKSSFVSNWNRMNPKKILDSSSIHRFDSGGKLTREIGGKIEKYRKEIIEGAFTKLSDSAIEEEDMPKLKMLGCRYIDHINPFIWYILSVSEKYNDYNSLFEGIIDILFSYISKYRIAEYLSLMVMEFSINAELSQLKQLSTRIYKDKTDFNKILSNELVRKELLKYLEKQHEFLTLSWKIHGNSTSIGTRTKFQVLIYNKDREYQKLKEDLDSKKAADIKKKTLLDYYQEESEDRFGSDLGLYYLSFMDEACRAQDIHFESNIHQLPDRGLNIITLTLILS